MNLTDSYGIADAPAKWQKVMDQVLDGIPFVKCILDDMLVSGRSESEHLQNLEQVLARLQEFGLKVNTKMCLLPRARGVLRP